MARRSARSSDSTGSEPRRLMAAYAWTLAPRSRVSRGPCAARPEGRRALFALPRLRHYSVAFAIVLAALAANSARADLSGHVAAVSDYRFRGVSQSDGDPAIQGSVAYDHSSGLFAGLFASTVNFSGNFQANFETFVQAGFARRMSTDFSWEIGIGHYAFMDATSDWNYSEPFFGVTWRDVNVRVHY